MFWNGSTAKYRLAYRRLRVDASAEKSAKSKREETANKHKQTNQKDVVGRGLRANEQLLWPRLAAADLFAHSIVDHVLEKRTAFHNLEHKTEKPDAPDCAETSCRPKSIHQH